MSRLKIEFIGLNRQVILNDKPLEYTPIEGTLDTPWNWGYDGDNVVKLAEDILRTYYGKNPNRKFVQYFVAYVLAQIAENNAIIYVDMDKFTKNCDTDSFKDFVGLFTLSGPLIRVNQFLGVLAENNNNTKGIKLSKEFQRIGSMCLIAGIVKWNDEGQYYYRDENL